MANTYEETIENVTIASVDAALQSTKPVTANELKGTIIANSRNEILIYNSIAQPGAKWKVPTELVPFQIAYILIK